MVGTRKRSGAMEEGENGDINGKRTRTEEVKAERMASSPMSLRKKAILNSDSDSSRSRTPTRTSRRLSTSDSQEADECKTPVKPRQALGLAEKPDTPIPSTRPTTRRSIRGLGTDADNDPDTPQTPSKRSRKRGECEEDNDEKKEENDGKVKQDTGTPSTPVRRSRRLSGSGSDLEVTGVQTPTRRGRRSVGPADDKNEIDKPVENKRRRSIRKTEEEDDSSDALAIIEEMEEDNNEEKLNKEGLETIAENEEEPDKEAKEEGNVVKAKPTIEDTAITQTPTKRSRRSGMECNQSSTPSTPMRRSRRLSSSEVDLPAVQTPTRRGRRSVVDPKEEDKTSKATEAKSKKSETTMETEEEDKNKTTEEEVEEKVESGNQEELKVIVEGAEVPEKEEDNEGKVENIEEDKVEQREDKEKDENIEEDKVEQREDKEKDENIKEDKVEQREDKEKDDEKEQEDAEMHEPLRLSPPSTPDEKAETNNKTKDKNETTGEQVSNTTETEEISCSVPDGKPTTAVDVKEASGNIDTTADGKENMAANVTPQTDKPDDQKNNKEMKKKKKKKKKAKEMTDEEIKKEGIRNLPKGMPVSGRFWKEEKKSFRTTKKGNKGITTTWAKKMQMKQERKEFGTIKKELEEEKQRKREELQRRQELNKTRREENAKKAEVVQVIKDPSKIKKMSKKQLRYIATRDTTVINKSYK